MTQASTAFGFIVPGGAPVGMAASFAMLRSWGLHGAQVGLAVTLTGLWNQLSTFLFPVVAVALLVASHEASRTLEVLALVGIVLSLLIGGAIGAALARSAFARRIGDLAARGVSRAQRLLRRGPVAWDAGAPLAAADVARRSGVEQGLRRRRDLQRDPARPSDVEPRHLVRPAPHAGRAAHLPVGAVVLAEQVPARRRDARGDVDVAEAEHG